MWKDAYLESRVLSADPLELIRILYQHALDSVQFARKHLAEGDIAARSRCISQAIGAVSELSGSLDHSVGGSISRNLEQLYHYITQKLFEANFKQHDGLLAEVEALLVTLSEAWKPQYIETTIDYPVEVAAAAMPCGIWQDSAGQDAHGWSA
jgi:flagellar secretion chaperone FliS